MVGKKYYQEWDEEEIDDYLGSFNILILFVVNTALNEAEIVIHGKLDNDQKDRLNLSIGTIFGGSQISEQLCQKINDYAEKWYGKFVLRKRAHVINCKKENK